MMFRRAKKRKSAKVELTGNREEPHLTLRSRDGLFNEIFPYETILSMRQLYSRIESQSQDVPKRLGMTSSIRKEGVSYLTRAFATTIAHDAGVSVCIVETNWWAPSVDTQEGLGAIISGELSLSDAIVETNHANLAIIPAGNLSPNARAIGARSETLRTIFMELDDQFDHILIDIPAIHATSESIPLANLADSLCMIVRQGVTSSPRIRKSLDLLGHLDVIGVVMNQVETYTPGFLLNLFPTE
ncbi:MAG: Mrp family chromosome partitioning ATPase [Cellvibrionaceae bacterium]|jgi:Mrp family chromosome partitioning ATPase